MYELIHLALRTDSTRVVTYLSSREITRVHGDTHGGDPAKLARVAESDRQQVSFFAEFLNRLKNAPDAGGNLLDNTMIVFGSGMKNGEDFSNGTGSHGVRKIPLLFAGGGNFGVRHGQHLMFPTTARCSARFSPRCYSEPTFVAESVSVSRLDCLVYRDPKRLRYIH